MITVHRPVRALVCSIALAVGVTAGIAAAATVPGHAASAAKVCAVPRGARISKKAATVVVYSYRKRDRQAGPGRAWVACSKLAGKRISLGFVADEPCTTLDAVEGLRLAGSYLAYVTETSDCTGENGDASVNLVDLKAARLVASAGATSDSLPNSVTITELSLRADGALAWIAHVDSERLQPWLVYAGDSSGVRALDSSDTPLTALTMPDGSVAWTNAGQPRSAPLGRGPAVNGN